MYYEGIIVGAAAGAGSGGRLGRRSLHPAPWRPLRLGAARALGLGYGEGGGYVQSRAVRTGLFTLLLVPKLPGAPASAFARI